MYIYIYIYIYNPFSLLQYTLRDDINRNPVTELHLKILFLRTKLAIV